MPTHPVVLSVDIQLSVCDFIRKVDATSKVKVADLVNDTLAKHGPLPKPTIDLVKTHAKKVIASALCTQQKFECDSKFE